jgi:hypothetical protein
MLVHERQACHSRAMRWRTTRWVPAFAGTTGGVCAATATPPIVGGSIAAESRRSQRLCAAAQLWHTNRTYFTLEKYSKLAYNDRTVGKSGEKW